jgi:hypothetical protein
LKQSETKDQTRKGAKIKGSNYNSYRGLDYKIVKTAKDRIENIHFEILKRHRFHYSLSPSKKAVLSIKTRICFAANCSNYGARFMASISTTVTTSVLSLGYKSQRRNRRQRGEEVGRHREGKKKEQGRNTAKKERDSEENERGGKEGNTENRKGKKRKKGEKQRE